MSVPLRAYVTVTEFVQTYLEDSNANVQVVCMESNANLTKMNAFWHLVIRVIAQTHSVATYASVHPV